MSKNENKITLASRASRNGSVAVTVAAAAIPTCAPSLLTKRARMR